MNQDELLYEMKLVNVVHAYHFSYKILLLISAPVCHPSFSQSVPCRRLSFPDRTEIDKHSLQTENDIITRCILCNCIIGVDS